VPFTSGAVRVFSRKKTVGALYPLQNAKFVICPQLSIPLQWQSNCLALVVPPVPYCGIGFTHCWICMNYLPLHFKQPTIIQLWLWSLQSSTTMAWPESIEVVIYISSRIQWLMFITFVVTITCFKREFNRLYVIMI